MKIRQIRDQLVAVGEKVDDTKLVNTTLNGFSNPWESFFKGICAQEKLPTFERLWDDCITTILTSLLFYITSILVLSLFPSFTYCTSNVRASDS
jgi:hypothetical protein